MTESASALSDWQEIRAHLIAAAAAGHAFLAEDGLVLAETRADAGAEGALFEGHELAVGRAGGDEALDGVAADIDDGDEGGTRHGTTEYIEYTEGQKFSVYSVCSVVTKA